VAVSSLDNLVNQVSPIAKSKGARGRWKPNGSRRVVSGLDQFYP